MRSFLRSSLVAAVILSTVLVGMRDMLAAGRVDAHEACSVTGESFRSSREDDSGTRSEQVEEDDGDEDEGRDTHCVGGDTRARRFDSVVRVLTHAVHHRPANLLRRDTLVRGPPALG